MLSDIKDKTKTGGTISINMAALVELGETAIAVKAEVADGVEV